MNVVFSLLIASVLLNGQLSFGQDESPLRVHGTVVAKETTLTDIAQVIHERRAIYVVVPQPGSDPLKVVYPYFDDEKSTLRKIDYSGKHGYNFEVVRDKTCDESWNINESLPASSGGGPYRWVLINKKTAAKIPKATQLKCYVVAKK